MLTPFNIRLTQMNLILINKHNKKKVYKDKISIGRTLKIKDLITCSDKHNKLGHFFF